MIGRVRGLVGDLARVASAATGWLSLNGAGRSGDGARPTLHYTRTRDGCRIALWNYRARSATRRHPVFLCHGLGSNRYDLDYPGEQSLARYLWRSGYDVWIIELRGAGASSRPSFFAGPLRYNWVFDDYVVHDIPAGIARVLELTGRASVHWVGHSMGGMLAYPFLATSDRDLVRSCVTVGAPSVALLASPIHDEARRAGWLLRYVPFVPYRRVGRLVAPFVPLARPYIEAVLKDFLYNRANMDAATLSTLLRTAVEDLPASMLLQAVEWYDHKHFRSYYRTFSVRDNLHRIEVPLLIVGGSIDGLTPPADLRYVFDRVSSRDKEFVVVGKSIGASNEYGHVDLILGKNAHRDVFPTIQAWLDRHD